MDNEKSVRSSSKSSKFEPSLTLEKVRLIMEEFATERDWNQHHRPRNLALALVGEVGELCECFQWKGDNNCNVDEWDENERVHLGEELSDVMLYLVRLADQCNIDLSSAILDKMNKNRKKYPAHLVRGSSKKYTEYQHQTQLEPEEYQITSNSNTTNN